MTLPGSIWSSALLLCAVSVLSAPGNVVCANLVFSSPQATAGKRDSGRTNEREIAARFAPIFYQALGDKPRSDYITNFDFDGEWRGENNWSPFTTAEAELSAASFRRSGHHWRDGIGRPPLET